MLTDNIDLNGNTVLVTGAAGFIGGNLVKHLFGIYPNIHIIGIDSLNDYYDVCLKHERLREIEELGRNWTFIHDTIANKAIVDRLFCDHSINVVVNLAAQAGVRYSITNPDAYIESNIIGFLQYFGGLPSPQCQPSGLCQQLVCVWGKQESALLH